MSTDLTSTDALYNEIAPFVVALDRRMKAGTEKFLDKAPVSVKKGMTLATQDVEDVDGERVLTLDRFRFLMAEDGLKDAYYGYRRFVKNERDAEGQRKAYAKQAKMPVKRQPVLR